MGNETKIEWCDHTFNPWIGCAKVHAGCTHCYAEADQGIRRNRVQWGAGGTRSRTSPANWTQPIKWDKQAKMEGVRKRVFCASLADVFEDWTGEIIDSKGRTLWNNNTFGNVSLVNQLTMEHLRIQLFELIDRTPNLDWMLLTKRPENIKRMWVGGYRSNVWLGTSVSNQETANEMVPKLIESENLAKHLFVSAEPLLGEIDWCSIPDYPFGSEPNGRVKFATPRIDQVILGGESGPNARPNKLAWILRSVTQCSVAGVAAFVKQLGANHHSVNPESGTLERVPLSDKKGGDMSEWPEPLRVREFPVEGGFNGNAD